MAQKHLQIGLAIVIIVAALSGTRQANGATLESLSSLSHATEAWLLTRLPKTNSKRTVKVSPFDSRLRLPQCHQVHFALLDQNADSSRLVVKVYCHSPRWQVFTSAVVTTWARVLITRRALEAGASITAADVQMARRPVQQLPPGALSKSSEAIGHVLRLSLARGVVLSTMNISNPKVIYEGETVTISAVGDGIRLSVAGVSLENGALGEDVLVKNTASGRIIRAKVVGPHHVRVGF